MIGSLWTGVSGLSSHTSAINNESNNIANVNTVGYKSSRISFSDQIYQNKIGKGSYVQDTEKLFTQGSMKITGVDYDIALQGDGFFTVKDPNAQGTSQSFYTRAGNFRMGESGTLQTAGNYEVQGWIMNPIDATNDVISTNKNVTRFTSDFTTTVGSAIIKHKNFIESIGSKTTDLNSSAKSDSQTVFSGAGYKTKASKLKDVSLAQVQYNKMLQKYKNDPDGSSKSASTQTSQIKFRTGTDSIIGKEGDSISVIIDGTVYTQQYVITKTTETYRQQIWNDLSESDKATYELTDPDEFLSLSADDKAIEIAKYDKIASKIETYKAMTDQISNSSSGGLVAYLSINQQDQLGDYLDDTADYVQSTRISDMLQGIIQIRSLVPGKEFKITDVSETTSGNDNVVKGTFQTTLTADEGSGLQGLRDARDALARLVSGNKRDVFTSSDLYGTTTSTKSFTLSINIYDKDLGKTIPVPNDGATPPQAVQLDLGTYESGDIDSLVYAINNYTTSSGQQLGEYVVAKNINGNLVIEAIDAYYDVSFETKLNVTPNISIDDLVDNTDYKYTINAGSGRTIEVSFSVGNTILGSMQAIYDAFKTAIDEFNEKAENQGYEVTLSSNVDGKFSITSQNNKPLSGTLEMLTTPNTLNSPTTQNTNGVASVLDEATFTLSEVVSGNVYSITIGTKTFSFTASTSSTIKDVLQDLRRQIAADTDLKDQVTLSLSTSSLKITQKAFSTPYEDQVGLTMSGNESWTTIVNPGVTKGEPASVAYTFADLATDRSKTNLALTLNGVTLEIQTSDDPTIEEIVNKFNEELAKRTTLDAAYKIEVEDGKMVLSERATSTGYKGAFASTPKLVATALEATDWSITKQATQANTDYSGRRGAAGEFMEITTKVDQTASQDSIQLRLDLLNISDNGFGKFSVDSSGVVTITEGGVEFAVGQISIARFANNRELEAYGENLFVGTQGSGNAIYSLDNANTDGMKGQTLELSEADLSTSLVNLMIFQRAFEANAKSITTSDEMLTTLINLKR